MRRHLICSALLAVMGLIATPAHAASRNCGLTARIDGVRYDMRETKGTLACATVKRAVTRFLRASCARGHSVTVRVYAPK